MRSGKEANGLPKVAGFFISLAVRQLRLLRRSAFAVHLAAGCRLDEKPAFSRGAIPVPGNPQAAPLETEPYHQALLKP